MLKDYNIRQRRRLFPATNAPEPVPPPAPDILPEIAPEPFSMSATPSTPTPRKPRHKNKAPQTQLQANLCGLPSGNVIMPSEIDKPAPRPVLPHNDIAPHQRASANLSAYGQQESPSAPGQTWKQEIEMMRAFFAAHPPANGTRLNAATLIEDAALFITTNLETVSRYDGNRYFEPAMNRLRLLMNLVNKNTGITPDKTPII
jgi:hypothetical protein